MPPIAQRAVDRAYLPWYRRRGQWWMWLCAIALAVVAIVGAWPWRVTVVALLAGAILVSVIDALVARHIRARHPLPASVPITEFRLPLPLRKDLLHGHADPT